MEWFKKHWWMFLIFVGLTGTVITLIAVGVSTHEEPGLMRVCWRSDGVAIYDQCPEGSGQDLVWDHLPVTISVRAYDGVAETQADADRAVGEAIQLWNDQTDLTLFRIAGGDEMPDAVLVWGEPFEVGVSVENEGGFVEHRSVGVMSAEVGIERIGTSRLAYLITLHELGHLIGLAHDVGGFRSSPMYPTTEDDTWEDRLSFTRVTDWDREVLRTTYGAR